MTQPLHSLRLALRSLRRGRGSTAVAVLTLGIGLTAAVAILGMFDAAARPLPVPDGADVVALKLRNDRAERVAAPAALEQWALGPGVADAGALRMTQATLLHPDAPALRAWGAVMHPSVLRLLRVPPALGRLPTTDADDQHTIVLGWQAWSELGADPALLGASLDVDGTQHTIIGVMPEGFGFPENNSFWTVLPSHESGEVVARLSPGSRHATVRRALESRVAQAGASLDLTDGPHTVEVTQWTMSRDDDGGEAAIFAGLALLVVILLIVCASNVATLLLVRGNERATVLAVHSALGASRSQVALQLFMEAFLIAVGGGLVGLLFGFGVLRWMQLNLAQHWGYYWMTMEVRLPVVVGAFAAVLVTAIIAGTVPSLRATRIDLARVLVGQGRAHDPRERRLGRWFVGAQVTLSTIGLIAAAFLAWESTQISATTTPLPMESTAVATITLPDGHYDDDASRELLLERLRAGLATIPGVQHVSLGGGLPGGRRNSARLHRPGDNETLTPPLVEWLAADPQITALYGMRIRAGRALTAQDDALAPSVALVTTDFARQYIDGDPVGRPIRLAGVHGEESYAEIVGVVDDWFGGSAARARVIVPLAQVWPPILTIAVRSTGDPGTVLPGIRAAVARVDERLPVEQLTTLQERMDWFLRMPRIIAAFGVLGGIASALVAAVGLYGVMSFQVRSRMRELGIRMAVGASTRRIAFEIIRECLLRVAPGLAIGIAVGLLVGNVIGGFTDATVAVPSTRLFAGVVVTMLGLGIVAALGPAVRAARLDPQEVLRLE